MCYEVNVGSALVSMSHSAIDLFTDQIPSKPESQKVDNLLVNSYADLESLRKRMDRFEQEERSNFRNVHDIDERLLAVTSAEIVIIMAIFVMEYWIFKRYLSSFSLI